MRAILDPNVVISGLIAHEGAPAQLLSHCRAGRFEVIVSPLLLEEVRRALGYPKLRRRLSGEDAEAAVLWLAGAAIMAPDATTDAPVQSSDPGDDYLIALAAEQKAALVSGDRHLLDLTHRIPVYSPRDFLDLIKSG